MDFSTGTKSELLNLETETSTTYTQLNLVIYSEFSKMKIFLLNIKLFFIFNLPSTSSSCWKQHLLCLVVKFLPDLSDHKQVI